MGERWAGSTRAAPCACRRLSTWASFVDAAEGTLGQSSEGRFHSDGRDCRRSPTQSIDPEIACLVDFRWTSAVSAKILPTPDRTFDFEANRPHRRSPAREAGRRRRATAAADEQRRTTGPELRRLEKTRTPAFGCFRPPWALNGPRGRHRTTRDEKPALGKRSGLPGTAY